MYFKKNLQKKREIGPKTSLSASPSFLPTGENHKKIKYPRCCWRKLSGKRHRFVQESKRNVKKQKKSAFET
jgi:hypothetical protein